MKAALFMTVAALFLSLVPLAVQLVPADSGITTSGKLVARGLIAAVVTLFLLIKRGNPWFPENPGFFS